MAGTTPQRCYVNARNTNYTTFFAHTRRARIEAANNTFAPSWVGSWKPKRKAGEKQREACVAPYLCGVVIATHVHQHRGQHQFSPAAPTNASLDGRGRKGNCRPSRKPRGHPSLSRTVRILVVQQQNGAESGAVRILKQCVFFSQHTTLRPPAIGLCMVTNSLRPIGIATRSLYLGTFPSVQPPPAMDTDSQRAPGSQDGGPSASIGPTGSRGL